MKDIFVNCRLLGFHPMSTYNAGNANIASTELASTQNGLKLVIEGDSLNIVEKDGILTVEDPPTACRLVSGT